MLQEAQEMAPEMRVGARESELSSPRAWRACQRVLTPRGTLLSPGGLLHGRWLTALRGRAPLALLCDLQSMHSRLAELKHRLVGLVDRDHTLWEALALERELDALDQERCARCACCARFACCAYVACCVCCA